MIFNDYAIFLFSPFKEAGDLIFISNYHPNILENVRMLILWSNIFNLAKLKENSC